MTAMALHRKRLGGLRLASLVDCPAILEGDACAIRLTVTGHSTSTLLDRSVPAERGCRDGCVCGVVDAYW